MSAVLDSAALERLAQTSADAPVLSVHLLTDPRLPANTRAAPAWKSALTTGLNEAAEELEHGDDRDHRLAFRELHERVLHEVEALDATSRGRSLVWFVALDGSIDERFSAQLALPTSVVRLGPRPCVAPAVDLVSRGAPAGVVLVGHERVRMLEWAHGTVDEAGDLELEIDRTDWRRYGGSAGSGRQRSAVTHTEHLAAREQDHRDRFLTEAAAEVSARIERAGWKRVVLVGPTGQAAHFYPRLRESVRDRVRLGLSLNLLALPASDVASRLAPYLDGLHRADALSRADGLAAADPRSVSGPPEVLTALAEQRVDELILDPLHVPVSWQLPAVAQQVVADDGPERAGETAVRAAFATGAAVTAVSVEDSPALAAADGMLAHLRW